MPGGGGQGVHYFFRIDVEDSGGSKAYVPQVPGGGAAAAAKTDAAIVLRLIENSDPQPQEDGTLKVAMSNYQDDEEFSDFLRTFAYAVTSGTTTLPDVVLENGSKLSKAGGGSLVGHVYYGILNEEDDKIKVYYSVGRIAKTSGATSYKATDWSKPSVEYQSITAAYDATFLQALLDDEIVDPAADLALDKGMGFDVAWIAKA